jgi:S-adenosylmethionine hydrolase
VGLHEITTIVRTYGEAMPGTPVALVGSQGFIEVAVVEGRADKRFDARTGTLVAFDGPASEFGPP